MKYLDVEIRPMTDNDLPMVMEIENSTILNPYKEKDFLYEMHENPVSYVWVIEYSNASLGLKTVVGFLDFWITFDSGTICQIAVHPDIQRSGVGTELMNEMIKELKAKRVRTMTLEVRASNSKAINFYKKFGFKAILTKEHYYLDGEDALYMVMEVNYNGENSSN